MSKTRLTRRALLGSTFSLLAFLRPAGARNGDRGIGGTGAVGEPGDRGIGGTGVIGTIRKFGSIVVNGVRIAYPGDVAIEIDGRPASPRDLRLGQVAQCVAEPSAAGLTTSKIVVASEVIGPIEKVGKGSLIVLGQTVSMRHISGKSWKMGQWIAVSGLRRLDGAIVASHVQQRDDSLARVSGPVTLSANGALRIGGLTLVNLDASLAGRRVLTDVGRIDGAPAAVNTIVNPELAGMPGVRRISIESYVARTGAEARFGSGLTAGTSPAEKGAAVSMTQSRAIVAITVNADGSLTATGQKSAGEPEPSAPEAPHNSEPSHETKPAPADPKNVDPKSDSPKAPEKSDPGPSHPDPAPAHQEPPPPPPEPEPKGHKR